MQPGSKERDGLRWISEPADELRAEMNTNHNALRTTKPRVGLSAFAEVVRGAFGVTHFCSDIAQLKQQLRL